ncbi:MAG: hypothetical protein LAT76_08420 [Schleiferiaceae bacterium]|nr:hypothetical protein [Schleiferiaceae bacterium]
MRNNPIKYNDPDGRCSICPAVYTVPWLTSIFEALFVTTAAVSTAVVIDIAITDVSNLDASKSTKNEIDDSNRDEYITFFRCEGTDKPAMHSLAMTWVAIPLGLDNGHDDPVRHNDGDNFSIFTFWSTSKEKAREFTNIRQVELFVQNF